MKHISIILLWMFSSMVVVCQSKETQTDFEQFQSLFNTASEMVNMKNIPKHISSIQINRDYAMRFLGFSEEELKYNDYSYNFDTDEITDYWKETTPWALYKFTNKEYNAFIVSSLINYENLSMCAFECYIVTTNKIGNVIDKKKIVRSIEQENQFKHTNAVILNDSTIRLFNYSVNEKYAIENHGTYDLVNKNEPKTKVTIVEYRIKNDGHIVESDYKNIRYAKESVLYYDQFHKDSDDPMNEY